jgi:Fur family ferric uptake transcriptional regulator
MSSRVQTRRPADDRRHSQAASSAAHDGSWVTRAEATLAAAGHKRGGARRALLELLAETGIRAEGACLPASAETGIDSGDTCYRARETLADARIPGSASIPESASAEGACLPASAGQECALSAQEIEDALRARGGGRRGKGRRVVSRASVYRILDELERLRLVQRVATGQAMVRYERVCERSEHHHHLVCDECGVVMPFSDPGLERAIETLSERVPLAVSEHEIVLHGSCRDCAA